MVENWKPIPGYEGRYEVSDFGRVKSVSFLQRYLLRNGKEAYRWTRERILATQVQNSGYTLVHLHLANQRKAYTVHTLVALVFLPERPTPKHEVNHKDGAKANCAAANLEWVTSAANKRHAVRFGLNKQAVRVTDPATGMTYSSIAQAAKQARKSPRTVRATFRREECQT